jgi:hypothetical protein
MCQLAALRKKYRRLRAWKKKDLGEPKVIGNVPGAIPEPPLLAERTG